MQDARDASLRLAELAFLADGHFDLVAVHHPFGVPGGDEDVLPSVGRDDEAEAAPAGHEAAPDEPPAGGDRVSPPGQAQETVLAEPGQHVPQTRMLRTFKMERGLDLLLSEPFPALPEQVEYLIYFHVLYLLSIII